MARPGTHYWRRRTLTVLVVSFSMAGLTGQISGQPTPPALMTSPTGVAKPDLTGFWKIDCRDNFGVKIEHAGDDLYSLSFCGPGGCFEPGTWTPNSPIFGDRRYRVLGMDTIQLPFGDGFDTYHRCPSQGVGTTGREGSAKQEELPPETTSSVHFKEYYQGLPDLDKDQPFAKQTPEQAAALRALVLRQQHKSEPCPTDQTPVPGAHEICGAAASAARAILEAMSRGLDGQHFSHVWLADFDAGPERDLLVQYDKTASEGPGPNRYAAFFFFQWEDQTYAVTAAA